MKTAELIERPQFVGEKGSKLYTLQHFPPNAPLAHVVYLPPFGEEMNRSRALVVKQARKFAGRGYSCTVMDFYGTGDSEGELAEASIDLWLQNVVCVANFLRDKNDVPIVLWGVRLGGLLALELAGRFPESFKKLVLWQPVVSGSRFLTQLLRLRIAALAGRGLPPETTSEIRAQLSSGQEVDVAGYTLNDELVTAIEQLSISESMQVSDALIHWFEHVNGAEESLTRPVQKALDTLQALGNEVSLHKFSSAPVWQLQKRHDSPELIELTTELDL
jgi:exosortase A-associated hydrolase 2